MYYVCSARAGFEPKHLILVLVARGGKLLLKALVRLRRFVAENAAQLFNSVVRSTMSYEGSHKGTYIHAGLSARLLSRGIMCWYQASLMFTSRPFG